MPLPDGMLDEISNSLEKGASRRRRETPMKVYLSGPIDDSEENGHAWRDKFTSRYDNSKLYEWLNPLDNYDPENVAAVVDPLSNDDPASVEAKAKAEAETGGGGCGCGCGCADEVITSDDIVLADKPTDGDGDGDGDGGGEVVTTGDIVSADKRMIDNADVVIVREEWGFSRGTPMEQLHAHMRKTPVLVWYRNRLGEDRGEISDVSPWTREHAVLVSPHISEIMAALENLARMKRKGLF